MNKKKRILLLANAHSIHTRRWAQALADNSFDVTIYNIHFCTDESCEFYNDYSSIKIVNGKAYTSNIINRMLFPFIYFAYMYDVRKLIKQIKPDIVHAHYLTSYGLVGLLSKFHPFILSAWGSDILLFPQKSFLHRLLVKTILKKVDIITTVCEAMNDVIKQLVPTKSCAHICTIPFGINLSSFYKKEVNSFFEVDTIVIGTIKSLEPVYGVNYLIEAFSILKKRYTDLKLKLLIASSGSQQVSLQNLTHKLQIANDVIFTGRLPQNEILNHHNMITIFVSLSISEGASVSVLEAAACEKPIVVSDVGGMKEVIAHGKTGFLVPPHDASAAANAIAKLIESEALRTEMGRLGRERVAHHFNWEKNVRDMINIYNSL